MATYNEKLRELKTIPPELVIPRLQQAGIRPEDIESVELDHALYYYSSGHPKSSAGKFNFLPDGTGALGHYLKGGELTPEQAVTKLEFMLKGMREKLFSKINVTLTNGNKPNPIFILTTIAEWKGTPE